MLQKKRNMKQKNKRMFVGKVVSAEMQKTVVVSVEKTSTHACLKKVVYSSKKYMVHDDLRVARAGDIVRICEGRPKSKTKYMYLTEVIKSSSANRPDEIDFKEGEL